MATTIVNPTPNNNSNNNGMGFLLGAIALIVFVVIFFIYVFPYIRNMSGNGGIEVNIPDKVDVNIQQDK